MRGQRIRTAVLGLTMLLLGGGGAQGLDGGQGLEGLVEGGVVHLGGVGEVRKVLASSETGSPDLRRRPLASIRKPAPMRA